MIAGISVTSEGFVAPGWGRARKVVVATITGRAVTGWQEFDVDWDVQHDEGTEGAHHARVARFLRDHHVDTVITGRVGAGMERMMRSMDIRVLQNVNGEARSAVLRHATD